MHKLQARSSEDLYLINNFINAPQFSHSGLNSNSNVSFLPFSVFCLSYIEWCDFRTSQRALEWFRLWISAKAIRRTKYELSLTQTLASASLGEQNINKSGAWKWISCRKQRKQKLSLQWIGCKNRSNRVTWIDLLRISWNSIWSRSDTRGFSYLR